MSFKPIQFRTTPRNVVLAHLAIMAIAVTAIVLIGLALFKEYGNHRRMAKKSLDPYTRTQPSTTLYVLLFLGATGTIIAISSFVAKHFKMRK